MAAEQQMEVVRRLCSFEGRLAGTDAERRAALYLAEELRRSGRRAEIEPTYVHPQWALVYGVHAALALAGSLIALGNPPLGFALGLAAAVSLYLDMNTRFYLLRRLFFRRASQNVVSSGRRPNAAARLVISAHYDAARTGYLFNPRLWRVAARLSSNARFPLGPSRILFWSLALLLPILGARMAGIDATWVSALQLPPTLVLIVALFLFGDVQLSPVVPAANDNASGVATALSIVGELDREPPENLDVWIVLTGAEECVMEGMRSFVRAHRGELERDRTYFLNLDMVGNGTIHYLTAEGLAITYPLDPRLAGLCEAIAIADREDLNHFDAQPLRAPIATDALPAALARYPAITILCLGPGGVFPPTYHQPDDLPEHIDPMALDRAHDFALELVRQIDRDVGRRARAPEGAVV